MATSPAPLLPASTPAPPIEAILTAIETGQLDNQLPALGEAINDRNRRVAAEQTRAALQRLSVGSRVRLDGHISPRYLQGRTGTVHQIDHTTVTVCLDTPIGRFKDGHVTCNPRVLHPTPPQTT